MQIYFLMVLEAWRSQVKVLADSVSGKGSLPGLRVAASFLHPPIQLLSQGSISK